MVVLIKFVLIKFNVYFESEYIVFETSQGEYEEDAQNGGYQQPLRSLVWTRPIYQRALFFDDTCRLKSHEDYIL